ncbi:MAG TPA: hypothetical protein VLW75_08755, partial [Rhizomicrobium sp.]|nr:hypothetical protein [Rhizomicrobium sp.]
MLMRFPFLAAAFAFICMPSPQVHAAVPCPLCRFDLPAPDSAPKMPFTDPPPAQLPSEASSPLYAGAHPADRPLGEGDGSCPQSEFVVCHVGRVIDAIEGAAESFVDTLSNAPEDTSVGDNGGSSTDD